MNAVLDFQNRIQTITCSSCGVIYGLPYGFLANRQEDTKVFYCPNGHTQQYSENEADRLRKQIQKTDELLEWEKARAASLEKSLIAQKAQTAKLKNRIAKGVCPCCKRSFTVLSRHMKSKHPDYVEGVSE